MTPHLGEETARLSFFRSLVSLYVTVRDLSEAYMIFTIEPGVYSFVTMATETEEYASTLRWKHSMGQKGIERLLEHFKAGLQFNLAMIDI